MSNFDFLRAEGDYSMFAAAALEAERVFAASPAMCAVGCRKALELAVKWVYDTDNTMRMPYKDNLQALIHEPTFRLALDDRTWGKLPFIVKLGNLAVHTRHVIPPGDALLSLRNLFDFIQWIDYCYGAAYVERRFDERRVPQAAALEPQGGRAPAPAVLSEQETRKRYIDVDMRLAGWEFNGRDVQEEYPLEEVLPGQSGRADYVLFGRDGRPLAVVEAKRTSKDPNAGREQAKLYADALERKFDQRPMIFTTNGFETHFWDDRSGPQQRRVSGVFGREDLEKLIRRRAQRLDLRGVRVNDAITDRYYQKEAVSAVCEAVERGIRRHLLVMATGTGKTRTAASLADVLSRGNRVTNVLFLADRTALVKQAFEGFKNYLPSMSSCNLCINKKDKDARAIFSTYPTMLNAIDEERTEDGRPLFTPAHFDLIIVDESHRSIFKKYRAIFEYFDALLVGLTATPRVDVDRNTYDFFELENGVPTYAYDYETALRDKVLVPYYNYESTTKFIEEGIFYDQLSPEDQRRYEEDFQVGDQHPDSIPPVAINRFIFNADTVDNVLGDLMRRGIRTEGGDRLGKTIIFAQNKEHAEFILRRFEDPRFPRNGATAKRVLCEDANAQHIIDEFKAEGKGPDIVISVDMMDTGIDVPECVNLVFFKKVRSKTKFWQMIGRGTRLCPGRAFTDPVDGPYAGKRRFLIFDYCGNFEFFRQNKEGFEPRDTKTLSESIFGKKVRLIALLQGADYSEEGLQRWRGDLADSCQGQVAALPPDSLAARLRRQYVEKDRVRPAFDHLTEGDVGDLLRHVAPIVHSDEPDEAAKFFDNFMYGLMLAGMEQMPSFQPAQRQLRGIAARLRAKANIPAVKEKLPIIQQIQEDTAAKDVLWFERIRAELRGLIQYLEGSGARSIYTDLTDPLTEAVAGEPLPPAFDFDDYRAKVNRYINEHCDMPAIYNLTHNIPLSEADYRELERILTSELGNREDYERDFKDTPLGLLVRRTAKMDREAVNAAFSDFISEHSLTLEQSAFVDKIIDYVVEHGYLEADDLNNPPFERPVRFSRLFDREAQRGIFSIIKKIRDNALPEVA